MKAKAAIAKLESTQEVNSLADSINEEVSSLALELPSNYDWKAITLMQSATRILVDKLEKVLECDDSESGEASKAAFKKLDTRMHLCSQ